MSVAACVTVDDTFGQADQSTQLIYELRIEANADDLDLKVSPVAGGAAVFDGSVAQGNYVEFSNDSEGVYWLSSHVLYEIEIKSQSLEEDRSFHFALCDPYAGVPDDAAFFCPNQYDLPFGSKGDVTISYDIGGIKVKSTELGGEEPGNILDYYPGAFVLPYDLDIYCAVRGYSGCAYDDMGWFLADADNTDPYTFANHDIVQPEGKHWMFKDVDLRVAPGKKIVINSELTLDNATVSPTSESWTGIVIEDGAELTIESGGVSLDGGTSSAQNVIWVEEGDGTVDVEPGAAVRLGEQDRILLERQVSWTGTYQNPVRIERLYPTKQWGWLDLSANGNTFDYLILDGGYKNVEIRSKSNVFKHSRIENGWRGISSWYAASGGRSSFTLENVVVDGNSSVGIVAYHSDPTFTGVTVKDNAQAGIYLFDAIANDVDDILVTSNALVSTTRSGVELMNGAAFNTADYGISRIADNTYHEVGGYTGMSGSIFGIYGASPDGYNRVSDANNTGSELWVYNGSSTTMWYEEVYWGQMGSPASGIGGSGTVNFSGWRCCDYSGSGTGASGVPTRTAPSDADLVALDELDLSVHDSDVQPTRSLSRSMVASENRRARMVDLRSMLAADPYNANAATHVRDLFALTTFDRHDQLGERDANMSAIREVAGRLATIDQLPGNAAKRTVRAAGEAAILVQLTDLLYSEDYDLARNLLEANLDRIVGSDNYRSLLLTEISILEHEGRFREAINVLDEFEAIPAERSGEVGFVPGDYSIVRAALEERVVGLTAALPDDAEDAAHPEAGAMVLAVYPNPTARQASAAVTLNDEQRVEVSVFNVLGRRMEVVVSQVLPDGTSVLPLNSSAWAPGVYFVVGRGENYTTSTKLVVLR